MKQLIILKYHDILFLKIVAAVYRTLELMNEKNWWEIETFY